MSDIKYVNDNFFAPDVCYKVIVVGSAGAGKTSLMRRLKNGSYNPNECSTLGIDFLSKTVEYKNKNIKLQIWDTAGQDKFNSICRTYYRGTHCAIVCIDLQNNLSYCRALEYLEDINILCKKNCVKILVATKYDSPAIPSKISEKEIKFLEEKLGTKCLKTSALNGFGIEEMLENIIIKIYNAEEVGLISGNIDTELLLRDFSQNNKNKNSENLTNSVNSVNSSTVTQTISTYCCYK